MRGEGTERTRRCAPWAADGAALAPRPGRRLMMLLVPAFPMQAFSSSIEPLRIANRLLGAPVYRWTVATIDGAAVAASNGVRITPDAVAAEALDAATDIAAVAGLGAAEAPLEREAALLRRAERMGKRVIGVSSGVALLARAGLLEGRQAAAHWEDAPALAAAWPRATFTEALFEGEGRIWTAAGGMASADLSLHFIALDQSQTMAEDVAARMLLDRVRSPGDVQASSAVARWRTSDATVLDAIAAMERQVEEAPPLGVIAASVGVTQRTLERAFRQHLGRSPRLVFEHIRLARARNMVLHGAAPLVEIALSCGFGSSSAMAKAYRRRYGVSPTEARAARRPC